jgi:hypothetical protein
LGNAYGNTLRTWEHIGNKGKKFKNPPSPTPSEEKNWIVHEWKNKIFTIGFVKNPEVAHNSVGMVIF